MNKIQYYHSSKGFEWLNSGQFFPLVLFHIFQLSIMSLYCFSAEKGLCFRGERIPPNHSLAGLGRPAGHSSPGWARGMGISPMGISPMLSATASVPPSHKTCVLTSTCWMHPRTSDLRCGSRKKENYLWLKQVCWQFRTLLTSRTRRHRCSGTQGNTSSLWTSHYWADIRVHPGHGHRVHH